MRVITVIMSMRYPFARKWIVFAIFTLMLSTAEPCAAQIPAKLRVWLGNQEWVRDTDQPILELGQRGEFDDTHIFAPCVARENDRFLLWYCGSSGRVAERVFQLGLATSPNGKAFTRHKQNPVLQFKDGQHSILTPTLLRKTDGTPLREEGRLRMWFSSTHFAGESNLHTLHESFSKDGRIWSAPSEALLKHVYAPSILKVKQGYRMWYVDVSADPWIIRHAKSVDGREWVVRKEPVLKVDQDWERGRLFYPTVVRVEDGYLMWYGSYWKAHPQKTAIGFAVSLDGLKWYKHQANPVLRPDPKRPWESHYTTSQSVIRLPDGTWRMWYASRKAPPFVNKYFAINTATWRGPR